MKNGAFRIRPVTALAALLVASFVFVGCDGGNSSKLHGSWHYASGEAEGKSTSVSGTLTLGADGKYDDSRYIGGIGGFRKGNYTVTGDRLTLKDGANSQTFSFSFGTTKDSAGKTVQTLLLRGKSLSFILGRKEA